MEFPLTPPPPGELLPLSLPQREVWLDQMAWPGSSHLNIGGCGYIIGPFDPAIFRRALDRLVAETEALRLVPLADGRQCMLTQLEPELPEVDLSGAPDPQQAMQAWWQRQLAAPFPANGRPPWRFALLRGGPELHALTIQFHHLVMDGWGTTLIVRRWSEIYNDLAAGRAPEPGRALPYRRFIEDSLAYRDSPAFARDGDWWLARLGHPPPALVERRYETAFGCLPAAHLHTQRVDREDYRTLETLAAARGVTPFSVMLAVVALYFARTRGRDRVVIGVPNLNREGKRYLTTPGMFVGVMPLVVEVGAGVTAAELIAAAQHSLRDALRHARFPLGEVSRRFSLLRRLREHRSGLFDVLLSYERQDYAIRFGAARSAGSRQLFCGIARYPLGITLCEFASEDAPAQDPELILEGSAACYSPGEVDLLARRLWHLVRTLTAAPDTPVANIDLLPAEERRALLDGLHQNVARHETLPTFVELFERQARLRPEATALVWDGDGGSLNYGELEARSRRMAQALSPLVTGRDTIIALALERGPDLVAALLAIARAGAAFLPLDPEAPEDRLRRILAASKAAALLIQAQHRPRLGTLAANVNVLDIESLARHTAAASPAVPPALGDLAYVLYTSGSTGEPKGVMIEHGALARRLAWLSRTWRIDGTDRSAQATQATFDPALVELLLPLIHGASIALPPPGRLSAQVLADFIVRHGATFTAFVPATLERFLDALDTLGVGGPPPAGLKLRVACCGGEVLPPELADRFLRITGGQLYNVYGPTETVIFATAWPCQRLTTPADSPSSMPAPLPIGHCVDDTRLYVLDERLRPLPFGECGEICIGGGTVARGYLGGAGTGQAAFCDDPFVPGGHLYRTGDRGWLDVDGHLHFAGRLDRQIKLRGYRIEPGEIEAALQGIEGVFRAAVQLVSPDGHPRLHAWAAVRPGTDGAVLQARLRRLLPDYMVPAGITCLGALPETAAGKVDFAVLPAPTFTAARTAPRPPAPGLETTLAELWSQALAKPVASATDDFFAIGGDSLAAIDIVTGIETRLGQRIPLQLLTEHPTIAGLARALEQQAAPTLQTLVHLGGNADAPPLFLVASGHGDLLRFQALADRLGQDFDVHMLQPPQAAAAGTLDELTDLADLYADRILAHGGGPACLAGFSIGGVTALETARRLREKQHEVALVLIDTLYPNAFLRARRLWQLSGWLIRRLHIQELSMNGRRLGALFSDAGLLVQVEALARYVPRPYDGPAVLIKSSGLLAWQRWLFAPWRKLMTDGFTEAEAPGLHGSLFESANLDALAEHLRTQAHEQPNDSDAA